MKSVMQECKRKLTFFLVKGGCSSIYSPRIILHEINLKFEQCKVPQLSYVLAHDEPDPTNSTQARAIDGIYMRALTTAQGGHEVYNLSTGEVIQQRNVTCVPIANAVVKAVEALAKRDSLESFKIQDKHGIIQYDSTLAGVGLDGQDEEEDPPEEEVQENKENEAEFEPEDAVVEEEEATQAPEDQEEESGKELLQG
jgi:hypothetical protein